MKRFGKVNESEIITKDINNIYKMIAKKYPDILSKFETSIADFVDQQNSSATALVINEGMEAEAMESVSSFMKKVGGHISDASKKTDNLLSTAKESAEEKTIADEVAEYMEDEDADEDEAIEIVAAGNGISVNECRRIFKRRQRVNESRKTDESAQSKTSLYNSLLDIVLKNKGKVSEKEVVETLNQLASDIEEDGFGVGKINEALEEGTTQWFGEKYKIDKDLSKNIDDFGGIDELRSAYDGKRDYKSQKKAKDIVARITASDMITEDDRQSLPSFESWRRKRMKR